MRSLMLLAFFLLGIAAGRVTGTAYAGRLWQRVRGWFSTQKRRHSGLALDRIDKHVQSLCPQVWRQRRLADAPPVTSQRNHWSAAKGRQEGVT